MIKNLVVGDTKVYIRPEFGQVFFLCSGNSADKYT